MLNAAVAMTRTMISPEKSDQLFGLLGGDSPKGARGGVGAGSVRRAWRAWAEPAAGGPPAVPPEPPPRPEGAVVEPLAPPPGVPRIRFTMRGGRRLPTTGVPSPTRCPPDADGTFSQYWLTALTVGLEQGAPGWLDAAAGTSCTSSAIAARSMQSVGRTSWIAW